MAFDKEEWNKRRDERAKRKATAEQQKKKETLLLAGIAGVLLIAVAVVLIVILAGRTEKPQDGPPQTSQTEESTVQTEPPTTQTEPPTTLPPDTVIHLVAGGDLNVTDKIVSAGLTETGYDFAKTFLDVMPVLAEGSVTMLNFEGSMAEPPYGKDSAPPQILTALKNAGVDLLQTANSKSVTNGLRGLTATLEAIRGAGMEPVGTFGSSSEYRKSGGFTMLEVQGIRIAVVAFTKGMDGRGIPEGSEYCVNLLYTDYNSTYQKVDKDGITAVLKKVAREKPDITVALLHWGSEYNDTLSSTQETICALMQEQGVDAIIGTHSHYVQKMTLDAETGKFVAYSLGDFLSDGTQAGTNYSVLLDLEITKDGVTGETSISDFSYTPIYLLDETEFGGTMRLLRIREAIETYEQLSGGGISEKDYEAMKSALARIESRVSGK